MDTSPEFYPPRRNGLIFHGVGLALFGGSSGLLIWLAVQQQTSTDFILMTLAALALLAPVPVLLYHGFALLRANYTLDRDGLRLRWGLRGEDIPLPEIEWIRPASDLVINLPLPLRRWPGALRGRREVEGLGLVEFMASETGQMLLVATPERVFIISPADPNAFLRRFQRVVELGSLTPLAGSTTQSAAYLRLVWSDRAARLFILAGLVMAIGLLVQTSLIIPTRASISLGYDALGHPQPPGPAASLLLLPVLAGVIYAFDLMLGLFFYRQESQRLFSYLLWGSSVLASLLLLAAATAI